jgi:DNA-binding IclR family transcriptional regulator
LTNASTLPPASDDAEADDTISGGSGTDIRAVSRVAQVLELFSPAQPILTPAAVAERLRLNRTTAYRYCISMAGAKLLKRLEDGSFVPGPIVAQLAPFVMSSHEILARAQPHLRQLSSATFMTAVLSLWGATGPVVSAVAESHMEDAVVTVRVGTHLGIDASQARVFYAFYPDQLYISRLLANLPPSQREHIVQDVAQVRKRGYATHTSSRGISIVAAPVFDQSGLCASMAIVSTKDMLSLGSDSTELRALLGEAETLTTEMGGRLPDREA